MGVWKLGTQLKDVIQKNADMYAKRLVTLSVNQCPLTARMIEHGLNTPEAMDAAQKAEAIGYHISSHYDQGLLLFDHHNTPKITRPAVIKFSFDPGILSQTPLPRYYSVTYKDGDMVAEKVLKGNMVLRLPMGHMDPDNVDAVAKWVDQCVRAERMGNLVANTVKQVLASLENTAQLIATWPSLATLVEGEAANELLGKHKARYLNYLRNPPKDLRNYAPTTKIVASFGELMKASDVIMQQGLMLSNMKPGFQKRDGLSDVHVMGWTAKHTDPAWTSKQLQ